MFRTALWMGVLRAEEGGDGGTSGGGGEPPKAPEGGTPKAPESGDPKGGTGDGDGEPFATFKTKDQFNERVQRAVRSGMRDTLGTDNVDEIKAWKNRAEELEAAEEERKREAMSEQEKLQADVQKYQSELNAAIEERNAVRFESHVKGICAELGVTNVDYAMYEIGKASEATPEGSQLDAKEHLSKLMGTETSRAALGLPAKSKVVADPASTSPASGGNPAPKVPDGTKGGFDATKASKEEFRRHLESKGIGLLGN